MTKNKYLSCFGVGIISIFASQTVQADCQSLLAPEGFPAAAAYFGVNLQGACLSLGQGTGSVLADALWKYQQNEECKNNGTYEVQLGSGRFYTTIRCTCDNSPDSSNIYAHAIRCQHLDRP